ncbi:MAG: nitroreductase family protein [Flavobacteriales bacterium]|nr:nitroreductase family protein [Flavobacteriales bacterium]
MNYIESLKWRYATKKFNPKRKISSDVLGRIIEAANLSASSLGLQPIKLVHINDKAARNSILEDCYNQQQIIDASDLIAICIDTNVNQDKIEDFIKLVAKTRDQHPDELNGYKNMISNFVNGIEETTKKEWLSKQAYIVLGTLLTVCAIERIDSCPMEGFKPNNVAEKLKLNELHLHPVLLLPIGYRSVEDKNQHLIKVRKPLDQYVHTI